MVDPVSGPVSMLFIIRVKRELKRVYRNGCRYNERLNAETGGSKTTRIYWVARVNLAYSKPSPSGHAAGNCRPGQTLRKPYLSACDREERGREEGAVCMCERVAYGRGECRLVKAISAVIYT